MTTFLTLFDAFLDLFLTLMYLNTILGSRKRRIPLFLFGSLCVIYELALNLAAFLPHTTLSTIICISSSLLFLFFLSLCYVARITAKIFSILGFQALCMVAELLAVLTTNLALKIADSYSINEDISIYLFCSKLYLCFLVFGIALLWKNRKLESLSAHNYLIVIVPIINVLIIFSIYIISSTPSNKIVVMFTLISYVLLVFSCIAIYLLAGKLIDHSRNKERVAQLDKIITIEHEKYEQLIDVYKSSRSFLHDVKKHFLYVDEWAKQNDAHSLHEYIRKNLELIETSGSPVQTGNLPIDAFVNNLISQASIYSIKISKEILIDCHKISIPDEDLCVILGNIFDNAIKSTKDVLIKDSPEISIKIIMNKEHLLIRVINSTPQSDVKEFTPEYIGDNTIIPDHGYGLHNIEKTVEKYGGFAIFYQYENSFKSEIIIPLPECQKKGPME